jgi:hypothetical protein
MPHAERFSFDDATCVLQFVGIQGNAKCAS